MGEIKFIEKPKDLQTSVRHSAWVGVLKNQARGFAGGVSGKQMSSSDFMEKATATIATKMLKGLGLYEGIKRNYEDRYGPVQEYLDEVDETQGEGVSDPMYREEE